MSIAHGKLWCYLQITYGVLFSVAGLSAQCVNTSWLWEVVSSRDGTDTLPENYTLYCQGTQHNYLLYAWSLLFFIHKYSRIGSSLTNHANFLIKSCTKMILLLSFPVTIFTAWTSRWIFIQWTHFSIYSCACNLYSGYFYIPNPPSQFTLPSEMSTSL